MRTRPTSRSSKWTMCIARKTLITRDTRNGAILGRSWSGAMRVLLSVGVISLAPSTLYAQEISDDWQFGAAIYGWLPDISGDTSLPLVDSSIDVDVDTILDHLEDDGHGWLRDSEGPLGRVHRTSFYLDVGESENRRRGKLELGGNTTAGRMSQRRVEFDLKTLILNSCRQLSLRCQPGKRRST